MSSYRMSVESVAFTAVLILAACLQIKGKLAINHFLLTNCVTISSISKHWQLVVHIHIIVSKLYFHVH